MNDCIDDEPFEIKVDRLIGCITEFAKMHHVLAAFTPRKNFIGQVKAVELTDLFADEPGNGNGTKVMKKLEEIADQEGVTVYVHPACPRTKEFYERFNFKASFGEMTRYAALPAWFLQE